MANMSIQTYLFKKIPMIDLDWQKRIVDGLIREDKDCTIADFVLVVGEIYEVDRMTALIKSMQVDFGTYKRAI